MMFQKCFKTFILVHTRKLPTLDMGHIRVQFPKIPQTLSSTIPSSLISLNSNQIDYIVIHCPIYFICALSKVVQGKTCRNVSNHAKWIIDGCGLERPLLSHVTGVTLGIVVRCKILIETWHSRLSSVASISIWAYFRHHNSIMSDFFEWWIVKLRFSDIIAGAQNSCLVAVGLDDPWWTKMDPQSHEETGGWPPRRVRTRGDAAVSRVEPKARPWLRSHFKWHIYVTLISIGQAIWPILAIWPLAGLFMPFHVFSFLHFCTSCLNHQNEVVFSRACGGLEPSGNEYETASFHHLLLARSVITWYLMWVMRKAAQLVSHCFWATLTI